MVACVAQRWHTVYMAHCLCFPRPAGLLTELLWHTRLSGQPESLAPVLGLQMTAMGLPTWPFPRT